MFFIVVDIRMNKQTCHFFQIYVWSKVICMGKRQPICEANLITHINVGWITKNNEIDMIW